MDTNKVMRFTGFAILGSYAVFNIITLLLMDRMFPQFGPELFGPYSIMASKKVFIAYHVWGIIIAIVTMYAMWKDIKILFMIGLLLMTIIMFYPYFSTTPAEKQAAKKNAPTRMTTPNEVEARADTLRSAEPAPAEVSPAK